MTAKKENNQKKDEGTDLPAVISPTDIKVGTGGVVTRNLDEMWVVATKFFKSGTLPQHYDSAAKVFAGMQVCHELGLPPITGMSRIYIVNGVPNLWGDLPLALCRKKDILVDFDEYPIDVKGQKMCEANGNIIAECVGYTCRAKRVGTDRVVEASFTKQDAIRAGLLGKKSDLYNKFPKSMYKYKARAYVLKDIGADVLAGIDILEHRHHINPDITPEKMTRIVQNEAGETDFSVAEENLRMAKTKDDMLAVYNALTDSERTHCRDLSRELAKGFDNDLPDVEKFMDKQEKKDG